MTTFEGQSGCPVVHGEKTIAIHIKSGESDGSGGVLFNVGRLLTLDVLKNLQNWAK